MNALERIAQTLKEHDLLPEGAPSWVAISGGPDSVYLAWALRELGYGVALAHVNYGFRPESDEEEALVRSYAREWGVALVVERADSDALRSAPEGLQAAARNFRYAFFQRLLEQGRADFCATGHQADDQAEQVLLSLLRANGRTILQPIPYRRGPFVRPLLDLDRATIIGELDRLGLAYAHDASNDSPKYLRNRVRNELLPLLVDLQPQAQSQLRWLADRYGTQVAALDTWLRPWYDKTVSNTAGGRRWVWTEFVAAYGEEALVEFGRFVLEKWNLHGYDLRRAAELLDAHPGAEAPAPGGTVVRRKAGLVWLNDEFSGPEPQLVPLFVGKRSLRWGEQSIELLHPFTGPIDFGAPGVHYLAADRLAWPLTLRNWQVGDRMQPLGMSGEKKLSDIFTDRHFDALAKRNSWVLTDRHGVVLVADYRIAERVKVVRGRKSESPVLRIDLRGSFKI